jgi:hypothetical protein
MAVGHYRDIRSKLQAEYAALTEQDLQAAG